MNANIDEYLIESGIEIPNSRGNTKGGQRYPFERMEVGDSFLIKPNGTPKRQLQVRVCAAWTRHASRKNGKRFTSRSVEGGVRVWRIA